MSSIDLPVTIGCGSSICFSFYYSLSTSWSTFESGCQTIERHKCIGSVATTTNCLTKWQHYFLSGALLALRQTRNSFV